ncbi:MAG: helix-turn-helix transcriptional regulator [Bacillota bacterium]|nr:helix-turn-helix transcriptional regulator [Bacillota bacterium]
MITFEPFWKTLKKKEISQYSLIKNYGVSTGTLDAIRKNKSITLITLNDLCNILQCQPSEIIQFEPDEICIRDNKIVYIKEKK